MHGNKPHKDLLIDDSTLVRIPSKDPIMRDFCIQNAIVCVESVCLLGLVDVFLLCKMLAAQNLLHKSFAGMKRNLGRPFLSRLI